MYFENEKHRSRQRSNDEFFRRMRGDEFTWNTAGGDIPTFSRTNVPSTNDRPRASCDGTPNVQPEQTANWYASCQMPSLAMVYAPVQHWKNLLSPQEGLRHGSIFTDLIKPLEVTPFTSGHSMEGGCCK